MEQFVTNVLEAYGPFAIFLLLLVSGFGFAVGEDLIIIPAGALIHGGAQGGYLPLWETLLAVYLGVVLSDSLWFGLCYRYGTRLLHRRGFKRLVHPRRLLEAKHQMERRGAWMVAAARFLPGSRTTVITMAGILHMPPWKFVGVTAACVLITAPLQLGLGALGARVAKVESVTDMLGVTAGLVFIGVALLGGLAVWRALRNRDRRPRARAAWLRHFRLPRRRPAQGRKTPGNLGMRGG
jgi:membrane protein DedA with SNARE-associated domain